MLGFYKSQSAWDLSCRNLNCQNGNLSTMCRIAEKLGVHPSEITEFLQPEG